MSIHPSLRGSSGKSGVQRNVMKRHERMRHMVSQSGAAEPTSAFGLPKIKQTRLKSRKGGGGKDAAEKPAEEKKAEEGKK